MLSAVRIPGAVRRDLIQARGDEDHHAHSPPMVTFHPDRLDLLSVVLLGVRRACGVEHC